MKMMYIGNGKWKEIKFPPFFDLEEMCRQTDRLDDEEWQSAHNNNTNNERTDEQ